MIPKRGKNFFRKFSRFWDHSFHETFDIAYREGQNIILKTILFHFLYKKSLK